ncbi:MAG TPA: hypothetical protein EYP60_06075, partial [bacterium (Candidatus Stahlbacteria)]|nr:hypothetical protein [Candidatus Stahlbacteria bacterium]
MKTEEIDLMRKGGSIPVPVDPNHLTVHQLRACAPLSIRKNITQKMCDMINADIDDSDTKQEFREHLIGWIDVMAEGRWKFQDYINACKYMTFKLMGASQQSAWIKVFPDRFQAMIDKGQSANAISSRVSLYNNNPLVQNIAKRTLPSLHVLNSDILQEAINVEATLMRTAKSETVRMKAAATLIEHLKPPEAIKVDLNVGVSNDTVEDLREITRGLAIQQQKVIESGFMSAEQIAKMPVISKREEEIVDAEFSEM